MKKNNIYILLIIQALLSILLLFVESTTLYIALGLFLLIDVVVLASLFTRKWSAKELYVFITLFVSIIYLLFLFYNKGDLLMVIAIGQFILFILSAIISYEKTVPRVLPAPVKPYTSDKWDESPRKEQTRPILLNEGPLETYDLDAMEHDLDEMDKQSRAKRKEDAKTRARALAYELEREASELKRAERYVRKKEGEATQVELVREALAMEKAAKQASLVENALKDAELKRQAKNLQDAEKKLKNVESESRKKDVLRQAKQLENAEKKVKELEFLDKQQELNRQAIELVKAQAEINKKKTSKKKTSKTQSVKSTTSKSAKTNKEPVFATKSGNNFHETGCMIIKKTPKKNLILFNTQKDALKKGYKPCNVCKP